MIAVDNTATATTSTRMNDNNNIDNKQQPTTGGVVVVDATAATGAEVSSSSLSTTSYAPTREQPPKQLPSTGGFANNHIMVNITRDLYGCKPVMRHKKLDRMAKDHADMMARMEQVKHSVNTIEELSAKLRSASAGENVQRGSSIYDMHKAAMSESSMINNIVDTRFTQFGMGTARGEDGRLYMCQLFR